MSQHRQSFSKGALAAPSESFRRLNPHLFLPPAPKLAPSVTAHSLVTEAAPSERRLRQEQGPKLNKLELAFLRVLQVEYPGVRIYSQAMRFQISNGGWYRPDHCAWVYGRLTAWECKGPKEGKNVARGVQALKCAAHEFPDVTWFMVWRDKNSGQWKRQEIKP